MERVKELDGLRALAILLVVAWHYIGIVGGPFDHDPHIGPVIHVEAVIAELLLGI